MNITKSLIFNIEVYTQKIGYNCYYR